MNATSSFLLYHTESYDSSFSFSGCDLVYQLEMSKLSDEVMETHAKGREDSEYVRLVKPSEVRKPEPEILESQRQETNGSRMWWVKTIIWCLITVLLLLILAKWGLPFFVKKVFTSPFAFKNYIPTSLIFFR